MNELEKFDVILCDTMTEMESRVNQYIRRYEVKSLQVHVGRIGYQVFIWYETKEGE